MLLEAKNIQKNIIKVHNYVLIKHIEENLVHQPLEGWWGVGEPEGHHCPLKKTISGQKSAIMLMLRRDPDLMAPHPGPSLKNSAL